MPVDDIALLCTRCFSDEDITEGKKILRTICEKEKVNLNRYKKRTGVNKGRRNVDDIVSMLHDLGTRVPIIVAKELHKLPPISFDTIDVTHFLHRMEKLESELTLTKNAFIEYAERKDKEVVEIRAQVETWRNQARNQKWPTPNESQKTTNLPPKSKKQGDPETSHQRQLPGAPTSPCLGATSVNHAIGSLNEVSDGGNWVDVVKRNRVIRRRTNSKDESKKFSAKKEMLLTFFSSNWGKHVEISDVIDFFKLAHDLEVTVEPITTKAPRYKCFRIQMTVDNIDRVYEDSFWPEDIVFSKYHFRNLTPTSGANPGIRTDKNFQHSETLQRNESRTLSKNSNTHDMNTYFTPGNKVKNRYLTNSESEHERDETLKDESVQIELNDNNDEVNKALIQSDKEY